MACDDERLKYCHSERSEESSAHRTAGRRREDLVSLLSYAGRRRPPVFASRKHASEGQRPDVIPAWAGRPRLASRRPKRADVARSAEMVAPDGAAPKRSEGVIRSGCPPGAPDHKARSIGLFLPCPRQGVSAPRYLLSKNVAGPSPVSRPGIEYWFLHFAPNSSPKKILSEFKWNIP